MNEQRRMEVQKKLEDEERVRRMKEGGEDMRAQLEMEEAQRSRGESDRSSGLTPEEERFREAERQRANSGLGETQQAEMAMWGRESRPAPVGMEGEKVASSERTYPAGTGSMYRMDQPPLEKASTGESFTSGPAVRGGEGDERMRSPTDYRAGTGSMYRPDQPPLVKASTGESFTSGPAMRSGEERASTPGDYRAGTGSMYRMDQPPLERASSGEYFTSGPEPTGQAPREVATGYYRQEPGPQQGGQDQKGGIVSQVTSTVASKGRGVSYKVTEKVKAAEGSKKAEDFANRAGEVIGRALRKTVSVTKEMSSGLKKGLDPERGKGKESMTQERMGTEPRYAEETTRETRKVVRSEDER